jgi:hypothetical protein
MIVFCYLCQQEQRTSGMKNEKEFQADGSIFADGSTLHPSVKFIREPQGYI